MRVMCGFNVKINDAAYLVIREPIGEECSRMFSATAVAVDAASLETLRFPSMDAIDSALHSLGTCDE